MYATVFATGTVKSLFFINLKFQAFSLLLFVQDLVINPKKLFSHGEACIILTPGKDMSVTFWSCVQECLDLKKKI